MGGIVNSRLGASALALVAVLLVSGCTGAAPNSSTSTAAPSTVASHAPENGGIEGLVTDDEARPVGGAAVGIIGGNQTTTSAAGAFAFSDLPPGNYKLAARAIGFRDTAKAVDVAAGAVTKVTLAMASVAADLNATAPNVLTSTNNMLFLHIISSPRKYWINDTEKMGSGETARAGVNALAFALGAGTYSFNIPIEPELAAPAALDKSKTVDIVLFVGPFFTGDDVGKLTISTEVLNGETKVMAGAGQDVTIMPDTITELKWSVAPEVDGLDNMKPLTWVIRADGASVGISIGANGNVKSSIKFPVT